MCTHYSLQEAIKGLQDLQALDLREYLTPLGYHLASLPVNVRIGKILLYGTNTCSEEYIYICNASEIQTGWSPRSERLLER
jgi:HrpA-like RNA helicase